MDAGSKPGMTVSAQHEVGPSTPLGVTEVTREAPRAHLWVVYHREAQKAIYGRETRETGLPVTPKAALRVPPDVGSAANSFASGVGRPRPTPAVRPIGGQASRLTAPNKKTGG